MLVLPFIRSHSFLGLKPWAKSGHFLLLRSSRLFLSALYSKLFVSICTFITIDLTFPDLQMLIVPIVHTAFAQE